jgi:glycosyltransferase involved in cell wall biosynthesis
MTPMHDMPLISVLVPTYNRLELLRGAVASVSAQTYGGWELVVVDDGSTDGTLEWLSGLTDPRIRWIALPRSGNLGVVRNRALAEARGEWIAFLDSDDAFERDKLEIQLAALRADPSHGWSYTAVARVDGSGQPVPDGDIRPWRPISGWILKELLRFDALVDTPTVMVRRDVLERVGTFDEGLSESQDYELLFRLAEASPAIAVPEPLTRKRIHSGSLSGDRLRVHEAWVVIYERWAATRADPVVQRICRTEARHHRIAAASRRGRRGEPGRALAHLVPVLRERPWSGRAWRALAGVAAHSVLRPESRAS